MTYPSLSSLVTLVMLTCVSCGSGSYAQKKEVVKLPDFPLPPITLSAPAERAKYMLSKVWEGVDEVDSIMFHSTDETEQFLVNYFAVGDVAGPETLKKASSDFYKKADNFADSVMVAMATKYLGEAQSPLFNDSLYWAVLDPAMRAGILSDRDKVVFADRIRLMGMNKPGSPAPDFEYKDVSGKTRHFYSLKGKPTVLLIYSVGCETCANLMNFIQNQSVLRSWVEEGKLNFLAVTSHASEEHWKSYQDKVPDFALSGLDQKLILVTDELFDVRAFPTIYFFDKELKVLAKDIHINDLIDQIPHVLSE